MRSLVPLALLAAASFVLLSVPDAPGAKEPDAAPAPSLGITIPDSLQGRSLNEVVITTFGACNPGVILDGSQPKTSVLIDGKDVDTWVEEQKAGAGADSRQGSVRIGVVENPGGEQHNVVRHTRVRNSLILPPPADPDPASVERKP